MRYARLMPGRRRRDRAERLRLVTDPNFSSSHGERYCDLVKVKALSIFLWPLSSPRFSPPWPIWRNARRGRRRCACFFNRFYQPEFNIEALEVVPSLSLSLRRNCFCAFIGSPFFSAGSRVRHNRRGSLGPGHSQVDYGWRQCRDDGIRAPAKRTRACGNGSRRSRMDGRARVRFFSKCAAA